MTTVKLLIFAALLVLITIVCLNLPRKKTQRFDVDVELRSRKYIATLGENPFETLSFEQQLLLLHAHYNVENYEEVIRLGRILSGDIEKLPSERKAAFLSMIKAAELGVKHFSNH